MAHGSPRGPERARELVLGRKLVAGHKVLVQDLSPQLVGDVLVERKLSHWTT